MVQHWRTLFDSPISPGLQRLFSSKSFGRLCGLHVQTTLFQALYQIRVILFSLVYMLFVLIWWRFSPCLICDVLVIQINLRQT